MPDKSPPKVPKVEIPKKNRPISAVTSKLPEKKPEEVNTRPLSSNQKQNSRPESGKLSSAKTAATSLPASSPPQKQAFDPFGKNAPPLGAGFMPLGGLKNFPDPLQLSGSGNKGHFDDMNFDFDAIEGKKKVDFGGFDDLDPEFIED